VVERARAMILATSVTGYAGCAAALKTLDYLRHLGGLKTPTLYVVGSEDAGAPPDAVRAMAAATPGSEFALIEGAAHIANMEDPEAFDSVVADFLETSREVAG
jgi:3-oxoadipate enol-lactonase